MTQHYQPSAAKRIREAIAIARLDHDLQIIATHSNITRQTLSHFLRGGRVNPATYASLQTWVNTNGYLDNPATNANENENITPAYTSHTSPIARLATDFRHLSEFTLDPYLSNKEKIKEMRARLKGILARLDTYEKHIEKTDA